MSLRSVAPNFNHRRSLDSGVPGSPIGGAWRVSKVDTCCRLTGALGNSKSLDANAMCTRPWLTRSWIRQGPVAMTVAISLDWNDDASILIEAGPCG
jgi:hypothetical protein